MPLLVLLRPSPEESLLPFLFVLVLVLFVLVVVVVLVLVLFALRHGVGVCGRRGWSRRAADAGERGRSGAPGRLS